MTLLSASAILALPRQFHVTVVENRSESNCAAPSGCFRSTCRDQPAGAAARRFRHAQSRAGGFAPDSYVLALPLSAGQDFLAFLTFTGGLSAATAMVIVASVALAVMISNDLIIPLMLWRSAVTAADSFGDWTRVILNIRRVAIFIMLIAAFAYYRAAADTTQLASIGLLSFAAVAQFAPALVIGLFWRGANARGALLGMGAGFVHGTYTLLLPTLLGADTRSSRTALFGIDAPAGAVRRDRRAADHGVFWSLLAMWCSFSVRCRGRNRRWNACRRSPSCRRPAAGRKIRRFRTTITINDLKATLSRYVGRANAPNAPFRLRGTRGAPARRPADTDIQVVRYAEQILASAVGSSSARLVLSLLFEKDGASSRETVQLLDDASEALQQNRDLLQMALNQMDQGISVFDKNLRLTNWNTQFRTLARPAERRWGSSVIR
jgi:PAS domain-containing protein